MDYYEFSFTVSSKEDFYTDLLINALAEAGFESFEETALGFNAFIAASHFDGAALDAALVPYSSAFDFSYKKKIIPSQNWNEVWESHFTPIEVSNLCYIRATFHAHRPEFRYEIVIDPKMAFGTGHHQTTSMMLEWMLDTDMGGKTVLDMGCGTGILAILADKLGATQVIAIDNDPVCYESTLENTRLNGSKNIKALCGSREIIPAQPFDIIFANINRNILLDQIESYAAVLKSGGLLFLSGFYEADVKQLLDHSATFFLDFSHKKKKDDWVALKLLKQ